MSTAALPPTAAAQADAGRFTFSDKLGRAWDVRIDGLAVRRIDNADLSEFYAGDCSFWQPDEEYLRLLMAHAGLIGAIVYAIIKPQLEQKGHSEEDYLASLDGPTFVAAKRAYLEAIRDFFQENATGLSTLIRAQDKAVAKMNEKLAASAAQIDSAMAGVIDQMVEGALEQLRSGPGTPSGELSQPAA